MGINTIGVSTENTFTKCWQKSNENDTYYVPVLNGTQENLIVSLIESRSGSTEDKTENLISLQFASRNIAKLNSIPRKTLFKQIRFSVVTGLLRREAGYILVGIWDAFAFSSPAEKFSWLLLPRFHKQFRFFESLSIIDENYFAI